MTTRDASKCIDLYVTRLLAQNKTFIMQQTLAQSPSITDLLHYYIDLRLCLTARLFFTLHTHGSRYLLSLSTAPTNCLLRSELKSNIVRIITNYYVKYYWHHFVLLDKYNRLVFMVHVIGNIHVTIIGSEFVIHK